MNPVLAASSWPPVVQTAIGAVAAIAGGAIAQWFTWQRATRLSYAAFAAEIQCVVKSSNFRLPRQTIVQGKVPPAEASFAIFEANVESLGGR